MKQILGLRTLRVFCQLGLLIPEGTASQPIVPFTAMEAWRRQIVHTYRFAVQIIPVHGGMAFATDLPVSPRFEDSALNYDPVMNLGTDSHGLMWHAPHKPADSVLDLCTGSGVQGIYALKHYADSAVLVDVNPRAIRFARFNAMLNGVASKASIVRGDMFDALQKLPGGESMRFDVILSNPPFIPSPESTEGYSKVRRTGSSGFRCVPATDHSSALTRVGPSVRLVLPPVRSRGCASRSAPHARTPCSQDTWTVARREKTPRRP